MSGCHTRDKSNSIGVAIVQECLNGYTRHAAVHLHHGTILVVLYIILATQDTLFSLLVGDIA